MRASIRFSASTRALLSSTTDCGSMNSVAPVAETSWTMPGTWPRKSALTGST